MLIEFLLFRAVVKNEFYSSEHRKETSNKHYFIHICCFLYWKMFPSNFGGCSLQAIAVRYGSLRGKDLFMLRCV